MLQSKHSARLVHACASGLRALQASGNGALRHKQHQSQNPMSQYTKCFSNQPMLHMSISEKALPRRAPLTRLVSLLRKHERMSAPSNEDLLAKTRWPPCSADHAPVSAANLTLEAPSRVRVRVMNCEAFVADPVWRSCAAFHGPGPAPANLEVPVAKLLLTIACLRERLRKKASQPNDTAGVKDLTIANNCIWRTQHVRENMQNELLHPDKELLQTIALQKCDAIARCCCNSAPVSEAANYYALARRNLK